MDHYAPTNDLVRPWRTRTMVVTAIAAVETLALVAVGVLVLGKSWFQDARANAAAPPARHAAANTHRSAQAKTTVRTAPLAPAAPMLSRARTTLLVLNGNGRDGAAAAEASLLESRGYIVRALGNAKRSDYVASIVIYRPGYEREARRLSRDLHIPVVVGLDGLLPSQMHGAKLAVIVGN